VKKKTTGAWLIHHTAKLQQVENPTVFDRIRFAGKAGVLLSALSESNQESVLTREKVEALAKAAHISPLLELDPLLATLEEHRLISRSSAGDVHVLGLTTASVLAHTSDLFQATKPLAQDVAALDLAEQASRIPVQSERMTEYLGDVYKLSTPSVQDLLLQAEQIGFVDAEGLGKTRKLFFNGNLFRRENAQKMAAVLDSLDSAELGRVEELEEVFGQTACVPYEQALQIVGKEAFEKLQAIGMYDLNSVSNELQSVDFLTKPAAFEKYGNAMVEDALHLAKAFVTSLTYGMTYSPASRGQIVMLPLLMRKLLRGAWVGPATAIGQDYKVLELKRVVQVRPEEGGMFSMQLLKRDIGELAFQALVEGDVSEVSLPPLLGASITRYLGPEENREVVRKRQTKTSKRETLDLLRTLRSGDTL
jgi:hypothetical protein